MKCRICNSEADQVFVDLGHQPPSNAYLTKEQLSLPEITYPLRVHVCHRCWLVQLPAHATASQLFNDSYAYFSSVSTTWVEHARRYVDEVTRRFALDRKSFVLEIASNDGYLLQFVKKSGIRCLGVEPTASTAEASLEKGIPTIQKFFGLSTAQEISEDHGKADLVIANNVLAHVPDVNDFVSGVAEILAENGVATFEFPHLMNLVEKNQFDTIYHEHYSYFSFAACRFLLEKHGLRVFDVQMVETHGGSLRVFATHDSNESRKANKIVAAIVKKEDAASVCSAEYYAGFQQRVDSTKYSLLSFLIEMKKRGGKICGYGAAAKGNTLLNFAGVKHDLIPYVCDAAQSKQGKFLPGSHIPILPPTVLNDDCPEDVLILPWNIAEEVVRVNRHLRERGVRFFISVPKVTTVFPDP